MVLPSLFLLSGEEERIKKCQGRVFAVDEEPGVYRIWMPEENWPGLAMSRAFGDFCLKDFGLTCTPEVSYRRLTDKDEFVVLATDGVKEKTIKETSCYSAGFLKKYKNSKIERYMRMTSFGELAQNLTLCNTIIV